MNFFTIIIAFIIFLTPLNSLAQDNTDGISVFFINVGKADSAIIFVEDKTILVDTGTKDSYDQLENALELFDITHLDAVIITHLHNDHIGGLKKLCKNKDVEIDALYAPKYYYNEVKAEDHPVYKASIKYDIPLNFLETGSKLTFGNAILDVIAPQAADFEDENNNSIVFYLTLGDASLLMTGDADNLKQLSLSGLVRNCDLMKVSHHGEDGSAPIIFLKQTLPRVSVISTNTEEEKDTPDPEVLFNLYKIGTQVYQTQDAAKGILVEIASNSNIKISKLD